MSSAWWRKERRINEERGDLQLHGLLLLSLTHVAVECHDSFHPVLQFQAPLHERVYTWSTKSKGSHLSPLHIFWLYEHCQLSMVPPVNSVAWELRSSWISASSKFCSSPHVTSWVSIRLLHISPCCYGNAQRSLSPSGQRFFQQPFRAVDFVVTMESFIFTV